MKKITLAFCMAACLGFIYCTCSTNETITQADEIREKMELVIEPGEHWVSKMKIFLFFYKNNTPQLAAWIEDSSGNYNSTIAVTEKNAKGNWISAPGEGRPESLPVWNHRQHYFSLNDSIDSVSSASVKGSFEAIVDRSTLVDDETYNIYLEINHSYDYNAHWTKDNAGVNGQPSLVYQAQFIAGQSRRIALVPIGYGSVDGTNGNITNGLETFTSALNIVKNVYLVFD